MRIARQNPLWLFASDERPRVAFNIGKRDDGVGYTRLDGYGQELCEDPPEANGKRATGLGGCVKRKAGHSLIDVESARRVHCHQVWAGRRGVSDRRKEHLADRVGVGLRVRRVFTEYSYVGRLARDVVVRKGWFVADETIRFEDQS